MRNTQKTVLGGAEPPRNTQSAQTHTLREVCEPHPSTFDVTTLSDFREASFYDFAVTQQLLHPSWLA